MTNQNNFWTDTDKGLLLLRVMFGGLILFHGWHKVMYGIDMPMARMESWGIPGFLMYFAYISEVVAPVLIIIGLFTRLSNLSLFITMTVVMYIELRTGVGLNQFGAPTIEIQIVYWLTSAGLFFTGPGRLRIATGVPKHWLLE